MAFYVKKCAYCGAENHPSETTCLKCFKDLPEGKTESEQEPLARPKPKPVIPPPDPEYLHVDHKAPATPIQVVVTDIDMKFGSMVNFMVKWVIATIPAFIILIFFGVLVFTIMTSLRAIIRGQ